jgi:hypothetical protein
MNVNIGWTGGVFWNLQQYQSFWMLNQFHTNIPLKMTFGVTLLQHSCWIAILFKMICIELNSRVILYTGKNDLTCHVTHREVVFGPVIPSIFDAWHFEVLCSGDLTRLLWYGCIYEHLILYITLHTVHDTAYCTSHCIQTWKQAARCIVLHAPKYALKYTPDCTQLDTPCLLYYTLPIALDGTLPACLTVRSLVCSQNALTHTLQHALKYTPNCTQWHFQPAWLYAPK